ncbi:MAG: hypothetical protein AVDCRST_MAG54-74, partial [uncultured Actinomycetospora sp.]
DHARAGPRHVRPRPPSRLATAAALHHPHHRRDAGGHGPRVGAVLVRLPRPRLLGRRPRGRQLLVHPVHGRAHRRRVRRVRRPRPHAARRPLDRAQL